MIPICKVINKFYITTNLFAFFGIIANNKTKRTKKAGSGVSLPFCAGYAGVLFLEEFDGAELFAVFAHLHDV